MTARPRPLEGLVAFVTGAESSLGLSIAEQLKESGASVMAFKGIPLKTHDSKFSIASAVPSAGFNRFRRSSVNVLHKVKGILKEPKNLADDIRIIANLKPEIALSLAIAEKGGVDILVNCCTAFDESPSKTINPKNWELMLKQSVNSVYNLSKEVIPGMSERNRGHIINVVSDSNQAGANIISMSLRGLTKTFQKDDIGFTTIIGTDPSALGSQQISSLVSFLATDNSTFSRMTLEVTEESVYQIGFKHTMGFRIPIVDEEELPEDISKHWWQISNSKPSLIVPKRRRSTVSGKLENTLRRLSLSG
ncbi:hypothetical protein DSO57_1011077 [Entomophthora muscae]|uniref:Uncharacterized protein n=1 Tax=Entomophthora muscae TaxID=34485 RepID=A0ACC2TTZ3_9FUNG|nr:hypothetical protein DSO57_1011077 [Entomophthora muscae]